MMMLLTTLDSVLSGDIRPPVYIYLPGIHDYPISLMAALCLFNLMTSLFYLGIISTCDGLFFFLFLNMPMVSSIITEHLKELNAVIKVDKALETNEVKCKMIEYYWMNLKYKE